MTYLLPFSQCQIRYVKDLTRRAFVLTLKVTPVLVRHLAHKKVVHETLYPTVGCPIEHSRSVERSGSTSATTKILFSDTFNRGNLFLSHHKLYLKN